jgi:hypothetical protein
MRMTLAALSLAAVTGVVCCDSAAAVPASAPAMKAAVVSASPVAHAQYYERNTRHGVVKCYREFVVGRYVCRHHHAW